MTLEEIKSKAIPILEKYDVEFAGLFGSAAREEMNLKSDVDIIVRFSTPKSLFDLVQLEDILTKAVERKVEVITEEFIHPYIKKQVSNDLKVIYGKRRYL